MHVAVDDLGMFDLLLLEGKQTDCFEAEDWEEDVLYSVSRIRRKVT